MEYLINVSWDEESGCWMGYNDQLPVAFDADTLEDLIQKIRLAASDMIEMNHLPPAKYLLFVAEKRVEAFV